MRKQLSSPVRLRTPTQVTVVVCGMNGLRSSIACIMGKVGSIINSVGRRPPEAEPLVVLLLLLQPCVVVVTAEQHMYAHNILLFLITLVLCNWGRGRGRQCHFWSQHPARKCQFSSCGCNYTIALTVYFIHSFLHKSFAHSFFQPIQKQFVITQMPRSVSPD